MFVLGGLCQVDNFVNMEVRRAPKSSSSLSLGPGSFSEQGGSRWEEKQRILSKRESQGNVAWAPNPPSGIGESIFMVREAADIGRWSRVLGS